MTQRAAASLYRGISSKVALLRQPGRANTPATGRTRVDEPGSRLSIACKDDPRRATISEAVAEDCDLGDGDEPELLENRARHGAGLHGERRRAARNRLPPAFGDKGAVDPAPPGGRQHAGAVEIDAGVEEPSAPFRPAQRRSRRCAATPGP